MAHVEQKPCRNTEQVVDYLPFLPLSSSFLPSHARSTNPAQPDATPHASNPPFITPHYPSIMPTNQDQAASGHPQEPSLPKNRHAEVSSQVLQFADLLSLFVDSLIHLNVAIRIPPRADDVDGITGDRAGDCDLAMDALRRDMYRSLAVTRQDVDRLRNALERRLDSHEHNCRARALNSTAARSQFAEVERYLEALGEKPSGDDVKKREALKELIGIAAVLEWPIEGEGE
ncbi:hypothetical protein EKO27_g6157 [Xylaria grammica]|uniref:Uncharacterized protein n=1 Tax=Xylaria grammica TaxID=363999 RepID=A0A439D3I0_9PEZI|nr:hypothetical protein EKO27_g6157 [Xylaria grammica]